MTIPIILDCDPGTDDALAILLALASPELDVRAITVAGGNVGLDRTLTNALALTKLAGSDVPVHRGADRPLLGAFVNEPRVHGIDGLGGVALPVGDPPAQEHAADAIRRIVRDALEPVTLVGIAPVTNLALALMTEPSMLLLDEPTAGVSPTLLPALIERLRRANADLGVTLLVIEHNMQVVMNLAQQVICLARGRVLAAGTPAEMRADSRVTGAYLGVA